MSQLSMLSTLFKQQMARNKPQPARRGPRSPTNTGQARGLMGATGSRPFQGRDAEAGLKKEMETLRSPIFRAFLQQLQPATPILDYVRGANR